MLDSHLHPRLKPLLNTVVGALDCPGTPPDRLTPSGFAIGVLVLSFLALGQYNVALVAILLSCLLDGLDGALTWRCGFMDVGGFLDVALDFLFYALVPFGLILADPLDNVLAGAWLLFAFIGTGGSLLAFAALVVRHQIASPGYTHESLHYLGGLTGGTEIILLFVLCCLFPAYFAWLTWLSGALCRLMTATRTCSGYQTLKRVV